MATLTPFRCITTNNIKKRAYFYDTATPFATIQNDDQVNTSGRSARWQHTSMCKTPRKPILSPIPSAGLCSRPHSIAASLRASLSTALSRPSKSPSSTIHHVSSTAIRILYSSTATRTVYLHQACRDRNHIRYYTTLSDNVTTVC